MKAWIYDSVYVAMFGYHSCGITAGKYWVALEESYLTNVQLKAMELRKQLQNLNKDRLTIAQYMLKAKNHCW